MSTAMWKVTENHAQTYIPDPRLYVYCPGFQQKTGVVFSVVGQVMGLLSECQYTRLDKLSETEKVLGITCFASSLFHSLSNPYILFYSGGRP